MKPTSPQKSLAELLASLESPLQAAQSYELREELAQAKDTYSTLLHYLVEGIDDPGAPALYARLVRQAHVLRDRASRIARLNTQTSDKYTLTHKALRKEAGMERSLQVLAAQGDTIRLLRQSDSGRERVWRHDIDEALAAHEECVQEMFDCVWTSDAWRKSDYEHAVQLLGSGAVLADDKAVLVGAVTLAVLEMFDERKLMLLFDAYQSAETEVSQRAAVGIVLCVRQHDERVAALPGLASRLSLYADDPHFVRDFFRILMQLQFSKMTDGISTRMRDDIIPSIMKSTKFRATKMGIQEIDDYMTQNGENPEWLRGNADDAKAQSKMREMAELQMEGADIYMSAFSHLKGHRFFQHPCHWLAPFSAEHPAVESIVRNAGGQGASFLSTLLNIAPFCNSDKYSFLFMLDSIGTSGRELLSQNLMGEMSPDELDEHLREMKSQERKEAEASRSYVFDLYRFFSLYPFHLQFHNPFAAREVAFTPTATASFAPMLAHRDEMLPLAEFFMRKGCYAEAVELFQLLRPSHTEEDADIWQKIGFCQQKTEKLEDALASYSTAYSLNASSTWTLRHLAQVAFQLKRFDEACAYYECLLDGDSENVRLLLRKVACLMALENYAEAIPLLYKATYLDGHTVEGRDSLAWCLLMTGNGAKALEAYESLVGEHPESPSLLLHLATVHLTMGNLPQAYARYGQARAAMAQKEDGTKEFQKQFFHAIQRVNATGNVGAELVQMLYDAVCQSA